MSLTILSEERLINSESAMRFHRSRIYFEMLRWLLTSHDALDGSRPLQKLLFCLEAEPMAEFWHRIRRLSHAERAVLEGAISNGQIESKLHLVEALSAVLPRRPYRICIVAAWVGVLARLFDWLAPHLVEHMVLLDVDPSAVNVATRLHLDLIESHRVEVICADANGFAFDDFDLVINCACEHFALDQWFAQIPPGRLVALQSTDANWEQDHIRCVQNINELRAQFPIALPLYADEMQSFESRRFTLIGQK